MIKENDPLEDEKEIISAINREGIFFRKAVMEKFNSLRWMCSVEYPYSLQKFITDRGISRSADIFANKTFGSPDSTNLSFIIECKKSYAPRSKWIFFKLRKGGINAWTFHFPHETILLDYIQNLTKEPVNICYDQTVLKPSKKNNKLGEKLQQANLQAGSTQIYQASSEVAHALYGIKNEIYNRYTEVDTKLWGGLFYYFKNRWFVPIVITNADLSVSEFKISEDTLTTGAVRSKDFKLKSVPWLIYEYPLPNYLHLMEDDPDSNIPFDFDCYVRKLPIIFLNSMKINEFLNHIYNEVAPISMMRQARMRP